MKSSLAVFSNHGDPFPGQVRSKTHYHPSRTQPLSTEQKQTVLSPVRLHSLPAHLSDALGSPDLNFLRGSQHPVPGLPESDSSGPFDESWPSSEGSNSKSPETELAHEQRGSSSVEPSVIARYMTRFRSGLPMSRLERSPPEVDLNDFWWLQTSPDSPDETRHNTHLGLRATSGFSPQDLERTIPQWDGSLSDSKLYSEEVSALQKQAEKLILQSESSLGSVGVVSSDGLGSSSLSSISFPESNHSRTGKPGTLTTPAATVPQPPVTLTQTSARGRPFLAPEEDILYQWRLRRKMEQAREGTLPLSLHGRTPSPPARIPKPMAPSAVSSYHHGQPKNITQGPCALNSSNEQSPILTTGPSGFPISSPTLTPNADPCAVPPHLHLSCDILPCVHSQHPAPCRPQKQEKDISNQVFTHPPAPSSAGPAHADREQVPTREHQPSAKPDERKDPRRSEKIHERRAKSRTQRSRKAGSRTKEVEHVPPPRDVESPPASPVHRIMGEVISQRLFSPQASPRGKSQARKPEPLPPAHRPEPLEIAARLLEQAEDSDGTEFADDPLLCVLREQRESLRERLRAVDVTLAEMECDSPADISCETSPSTNSDCQTSPSTNSDCQASPSTNRDCQTSPSTNSDCQTSPSTNSDCQTSPSTNRDCQTSPSTNSDCQTSPSTNSDCQASPSTNRDCQTSPSTNSDCQTSPSTNSDCQTSPSTNSDCQTSPSTNSDCQTSPSTNSDCQTSPSTNSDCQTSPSTNSDCQTSPSTNSDCQTSPSTNSDCQTSPSTNSDCQTSPSTNSDCQTSPSTNSDCQTSPSTNSDRQTSPSTNSDRQTSPSTNSDCQTSPSTNSDRQTSPSTNSDRQTSPSTNRDRQTSPSTNSDCQTSPSTNSDCQTSPSTNSDCQTSPSTNSDCQTSPSTNSDCQTSPSTNSDCQTSPSTNSDCQTSPSTNSDCQTSPSTNSDCQTSLPDSDCQTSPSTNSDCRTSLPDSDFGVTESKHFSAKWGRRVNLVQDLGTRKPELGILEKDIRVQDEINDRIKDILDSRMEVTASCNQTAEMTQDAEQQFPPCSLGMGNGYGIRQETWGMVPGVRVTG
ncbi:proline and serine-rich protein 3 [Pelodytes ibericus]